MPTPLELNRLTPEQRYLYEERAGIIEFCGNLPRHIAEREAWREIRESASRDPRGLFGAQTAKSAQPEG